MTHLRKYVALRCKRTKSPVIGRLDSVQCTSLIEYFYRGASGALEPEFTGQTDVDWNSQIARCRNRQELFITDDGDIVTLKQCEEYDDRAPRYEVQQFINGEWTNEWQEDDKPLTFETIADATKEVHAHFKALRRALKAKTIKSIDESPEDFRIWDLVNELAITPIDKE